MDLPSKVFLLSHDSYFATAEQYIQYQTTFMNETILETLSVWMSMVVQPLGLLCMMLFGHHISLVTLVSTGIKAITMWIQWIHYKYLNTEIHEWTKIVRSIGGPFISTNDPTYHMYVYADGMVRAKESLLGRPILSKERAKRL